MKQPQQERTTAQTIIDRIEAQNKLSRFRLMYKRVWEVYKLLEPTTESYESAIVSVANSIQLPVSKVCEHLMYTSIGE